MRQVCEPRIQSLTRGIFCRIHNCLRAHRANKLFENGHHGRKDRNFNARVSNNMFFAGRGNHPGCVLWFVLSESKLPFRGRWRWSRHARSVIMIGVLRDPQEHLVNHARFRNRKLRLHSLMRHINRDLEGVGTITDLREIGFSNALGLVVAVFGGIPASTACFIPLRGPTIGIGAGIHIKPLLRF